MKVMASSMTYVSVHEIHGPDEKHCPTTVAETKHTVAMVSPSNNFLCLMRIARARFLSDTAHCPMVTSKSVRRTTVSDGISCYGSGL